MKLLIPVFAAIFLTSCASKLDQTQKAALSSVSVAKTQVAAKSYNEPSGGSDTARSTAGAAGVAGGAIGGLVGGLIGEAIHATQHAAFEKSQGSTFDQIKANTPKNLDQLLTSEVQRQVKANDFFGPRVSSSSPYQFRSQVTSHGLRRVGKNAQGELLLSPVVTLDVTLIAPGEKKWIQARPHVTGTGWTKATAREFAAKPSLLKKAYSEAVADAGASLSKVLTKSVK